MLELSKTSMEVDCDRTKSGYTRRLTLRYLISQICLHLALGTPRHLICTYFSKFNLECYRCYQCLSRTSRIISIDIHIAR